MEKEINVYEKAQKELKRIKLLQELRDQDKEETEEYYNEERIPLSVETKIVKNILLSWGGPSDGFKLYFDAETKELDKVCYWFSDWGTYDETKLSDDEADEVFNHYLGGHIE